MLFNVTAYLSTDGDSFDSAKDNVLQVTTLYQTLYNGFMEAIPPGEVVTLETLRGR